jgi:hypothetical protein
MPVSLMVADWIEGYSLALFHYNSLPSGHARALRDGDQLVQYLHDALAAFPEAQRQRVKLVRWQQMLGEDPSYQEETAAVRDYLRSEEGREANQILEDMAAQFVNARRGQRTLKEGRMEYSREYLRAELVALMRGLRGEDHRRQPCHYSTLYHPVLAMKQDAGSLAIGKFQEVFHHIRASRSLSRYFSSVTLARNHDLELEPGSDGSFTTRFRPWEAG